MKIEDRLKHGSYHFENHAGISLSVSIGELKPDKMLADKVVLITGGTSGIGLAIAPKSVNHGAKIIIAGRNRKRLDIVKEELGHNCHTICEDICDTAKHETIIENAAAQWGMVNCLVHSAGVSLHEGDFLNVTEKSWDEQLNTNLKTPFFLTQSWLRYYRKSDLKQGKVIMLASDTSGMGSTIPYGLSKVGITSFTCGLAKQLITEGIRVNAIAPGTTKTKMTDDFTHGEVCRETTIGKRVLFPEEIAEIAVFLLSDLSTCISGQVIGCAEANICFDNTHRESETNP